MEKPVQIILQLDFIPLEIVAKDAVRYLRSGKHHRAIDILTNALHPFENYIEWKTSLKISETVMSTKRRRQNVSAIASEQRVATPFRAQRSFVQQSKEDRTKEHVLAELLSIRSLSYAHVNQLSAAVQDAAQAICLDKTYGRGFYGVLGFVWRCREGCL